MEGEGELVFTEEELEQYYLQNDLEDKHLLWALVEISGVTDKVTPFVVSQLPRSEDQEEDDETEETAEVDPNGMIGRAIDFNGDRYLVRTLDGLLLWIPEDKLAPYDPPGPEAGGFDLVWPEDEESRPGIVSSIQDFGSTMGDILLEKGYCVIQLFSSPSNREQAVDEAYEVKSWQLPKRELETAYMGLDNKTKYAMRPAEQVQIEPTEALGKYDRIITKTSLVLADVDESHLRVGAWGRMNSMIRLTFNSENEKNALRPRPLGSSDYEDGRVIGHINFLERRKLLMLLMVDNCGGEIELYPEDSSAQAITIPITKNKLLVLRHDMLSYKYAPEGSSLALQAWILSASPVPNPEAPGVVELPPQLPPDRVHMMSMSMVAPGAVANAEGFWSMLSFGTDAITKVPVSRFDIDMYYSADKEAMSMSYAKHGAFVGDEAMVNFDSDFFGVSDRHAQLMSPSHRLVLHVGYDVLYRAGITKWDAQNTKCGVFLGDSGDDWKFIDHHIDPLKCMGQSNSINGARLSHTLGLAGPCMTIDTACSSSLVAVSTAHQALRKSEPEQVAPTACAHVTTALALGSNLLLSERVFVLYCGPRMLSPRGRCFTFDSAADGFCRSEGSGGCLLKTSDSDDAANTMIGCLIGSAVNQDGRSASMTAPNGPSQQQCIRSSLIESGLEAAEITMAECHGTGTALGDPIEVSALRMCMQERDEPILNSSTKSNLAHMEACAGMTGILKCTLCILHAAASPNCHLTLLNPHMDVNAYPVFFETEQADFCQNSGISGVSSFGFGGTNARGDVWGRCLKGPRETTQVATWKFHNQRSSFYDRVYKYGSPGPQGADMVCVVGTWDAFTTIQQMEQTDLGEYSTTIALGETCIEHFHIVLNDDVDEAIQPVIDAADMDSEIVGPCETTEVKNWRIDGRKDRVHAGTFYQIKFCWSFSWDRGESMRIKWQKTDQVASVQTKAAMYKHVYAIVGTWTSGKCHAMAPSKEEQGLWTTSMRIGVLGEEEFHFLRDSDQSQTIYPAMPRTRKTSIPVRGPDDKGDGKKWLIRGPMCEIVTIQLRVVDGEITVTTASETKGVRTWQSTADEDLPLYYLTSSWNGWGFSPMLADRKTRGVYLCRIILGANGFEEFQISMDQDWSKQLYPETAHAGPGEAKACGPDGKGHGLNWVIYGEPGQVFEIIIDTACEDKMRMVAWVPIDDMGPELWNGPSPAIVDQVAPAVLPIALLFPGQGSQYVGMLKSVRDMPQVKDMLARARPILGYDILDMCINGPESLLQETKHCQPALFIAGLAGIERLRVEREEAVTNPSVVAGLSLGEYTALCAAGVFSFEDGLKLVKLRGEAMQKASFMSEQQMLSIAGLSEELLQDLCAQVQATHPGGVCQIANHLFPQGFSVGGSAACMHMFKDLAEKAGAVQVRILRSAGAFHTPLMRPAQEQLSRALDEALPNMRPPRFTVWMNATATPVRAGAHPSEIVAILQTQLTSPVLWEASLRGIIADGITECYEVGPMKQIKAMIKRIDQALWLSTHNIEV